MSLRIETSRLSELRQLRRQFGPGYAGKWAFRTIAKGTECVARDVNGGQCKQSAVGTVDADIFGNLDLFPFCGEEHARDIQLGIGCDLEAIRTPSAMSRNGWGRA